MMVPNKYLLRGEQPTPFLSLKRTSGSRTIWKRKGGQLVLNRNHSFFNPDREYKKVDADARSKGSRFYNNFLMSELAHAVFNPARKTLTIWTNRNETFEVRFNTSKQANTKKAGPELVQAATIVKPEEPKRGFDRDLELAHIALELLSHAVGGRFGAQHNVHYGSLARLIEDLTAKDDYRTI